MHVVSTKNSPRPSTRVQFFVSWFSSLLSQSKQLLQKLSLSLQSLLYEKSHFLKEIHTNRSFVSADTGIELVAKDAFLAKLEASKVGSDTVDQAKVCNTSSMNIDCDDNGTASLSYSSNATGSGFSSNESGDSNDSQLEKGKVDPHDLHLLRLADELTERKALLAEIERLKKRKRELNAINQEKTKQIERISSSVKMFYQSGKDIEKLFP